MKPGSQQQPLMIAQALLVVWPASMWKEHKTNCHAEPDGYIPGQP